MIKIKFEARDEVAGSEISAERAKQRKSTIFDDFNSRDTTILVLDHEFILIIIMQEGEKWERNMISISSLAARRRNARHKLSLRNILFKWIRVRGSSSRGAQLSGVGT